MLKLKDPSTSLGMTIFFKKEIIMGLIELIEEMETEGLEKDEMVIALMSGVYYLAEKYPDRSNEIFSKAKESLELKQKAYSA